MSEKDILAYSSLENILIFSHIIMILFRYTKVFILGHLDVSQLNLALPCLWASKERIVKTVVGKITFSHSEINLKLCLKRGINMNQQLTFEHLRSVTP